MILRIKTHTTHMHASMRACTQKYIKYITVFYKYTHYKPSRRNKRIWILMFRMLFYSKFESIACTILETDENYFLKETRNLYV